MRLRIRTTAIVVIVSVIASIAIGAAIVGPRVSSPSNPLEPETSLSGLRPLSSYCSHKVSADIETLVGRAATVVGRSQIGGGFVGRIVQGSIFVGYATPETCSGVMHGYVVDWTDSTQSIELHAPTRDLRSVSINPTDGAVRIVVRDIRGKSLSQSLPFRPKIINGDADSIALRYRDDACALTGITEGPVVQGRRPDSQEEPFVTISVGSRGPTIVSQMETVPNLCD